MFFLPVWFIYGTMIMVMTNSYDDYGDDNKVIIKLI